MQYSCKKTNNQKTKKKTTKEPTKIEIEKTDFIWFDLDFRFDKPI